MTTWRPSLRSIALPRIQAYILWGDCSWHSRKALETHRDIVMWYLSSWSYLTGSYLSCNSLEIYQFQVVRAQRLDTAILAMTVLQDIWHSLTRYACNHFTDWPSDSSYVVSSSLSKLSATEMWMNGAYKKNITNLQGLALPSQNFWLDRWASYPSTRLPKTNLDRWLTMAPVTTIYASFKKCTGRCTVDSVDVHFATAIKVSWRIRYRVLISVRCFYQP